MTVTDQKLQDKIVDRAVKDIFDVLRLHKIDPMKISKEEQSVFISVYQAGAVASLEISAEKKGVSLNG